MASNGNGKKKLEELVLEFNEVRKQLNELDERKEKLREKLLAEVTKASPDLTRSAHLEIGDYKVTRSAVAKIKWDLLGLQKLVGKTLYEQVIKAKVSVDENKLEEKIKEGKIEKKDVLKACQVDYQQKLLVGLKTEEDREAEARSFIELLDI